VGQKFESGISVPADEKLDVSPVVEEEAKRLACTVAPAKFRKNGCWNGEWVCD
jgi:hypothetical protein